jgi:hypothetical protein
LAIIADVTAPLIRNLDCTKYISARKGILTCTWEAVEEYESHIDKIIISLGSKSTSTDVFDNYVVAKEFNSFTRDLDNHIKVKQNVTSFVVNVNVQNVVGHINTYGKKVVIDRTVPKIARLAVVTNIGPGTVTDHQKCQLPIGFVELRPYDIADDESGIDHDR